MKLSELGATLVIAQVLFSGEFEESSVTNREGVAYLVGKLLKPIEIRSSMDASIPKVEVEELYLLPEVVGSDAWEKDEETGGLFIPGFKADLSTTLGIGLYQAETIRNWARKERQTQSKTRKESLMDRINKAKGVNPTPATNQKAEVVA